ncbi:WxcM-like domain-containing protein [Candidatus Thioglobus sp.]|nr:WxcM-like domain-containing protein [Candidatus Thioglobus sp.]MDC1165335.1 WxcM-like domain-containing protein [Candidatus Thioglobus sp.]
MDGITLTSLKRILHPKGDIFHAMKASDIGFSGFGEAYFSTINKNDIKGWKKHTDMTLNLVVVTGEVEFVAYDGDSFFNIKLSKKNYQRLTVRPNLWLAFKGIDDESILLNLANIEHDPNESENVDLDTFKYNWDEL